MLQRLHTALCEFGFSNRGFAALWVLWVAALGLGLNRVFSVAPAMQPSLELVWFLSLATVLLICIIEAVQLKGVALEINRSLPKYFSVHRSGEVTVSIANASNRTVVVALRDAIPLQFVSSSFPLVQEIAPRTRALYQYSLTPIERGPATFDNVYITVSLAHFGRGTGLVRRLRHISLSDATKIYPDFSSITASMQLGMEQMLLNAGAHLSTPRGDGLEFKQLREFREGDSLRAVDWKATARLGEPIAREYQEEQDQNIIFVLDSSRRMRAQEGNSRYFDFALNAALMCSYIALDKGDSVALMSFGGSESWLPPVKGKQQINAVLNHLYGLETSTDNADYITAAEQLAAKRTKRSLVVLISSLRDEDDADLRRATQLLAKRHLVMVVALREQALLEVDAWSINEPEQALTFAHAKLVERARRALIGVLNRSGVIVLDATYRNLHVLIANEYLKLKRLGKI